MGTHKQNHLSTDVLHGKRILIVGVIDKRKDPALDVIQRLGMEMFAVGSRPKDQMEGKVKKYILYDSEDHSKDYDHCNEIVEQVLSEIGQVDGCVCFWDTEIPLAALVTARLGKPGIPYLGASAAMSKFLTLHTLASLDGINGERTGTNAMASARYSSRCICVEGLSDIAKYAEESGFPAVLKTEFGTGSCGTKVVHSAEEAAEQFLYVQELYEEHKDRAYLLGASFNRNCVLMELLKGSEHCVDLAIFHGELVCAFVCDKGPHIPPDVFKTVITMPSLLPEDKLESVITAAFECCKALGLDHGVFDVDIMLTKSGPKLIEINPRVGGYWTREFILQCYNVDLVPLACLIACDIKPEFVSEVTNDTAPEDVPSSPSGQSGSLTKEGRPNRVQENGFMKSETKHAALSHACHMVGIHVHPQRHGKVLRSTAAPEVLQDLHEKHELIFIRHELQLREFAHELLFCTVATKAESFGKARDKMIDICQRIGLEADDVSMEELLDYFTQHQSAS